MTAAEAWGELARPEGAATEETAGVVRAVGASEAATVGLEGAMLGGPVEVAETVGEVMAGMRAVRCP
ncbi:hypothetical protein ADL21_09330 [Streptomyces albus subsp. albus]|nr:hypothetical protein ADL21_09330 [Streptomyces albus subsp. albus]